jgi:hypothetical protein
MNSDFSLPSFLAWELFLKRFAKNIELINAFLNENNIQWESILRYKILVAFYVTGVKL